MGILVNGNGNPHVYAHQDSDLIAGIVGNQTSIMPVGDKFEANQEDANTIALSSGVIITKEGRRIQLDAGTIDEFIIPTGAQDVQSFYIIGYHLYEDGNSDQLCETFVRKMDSASDTIPESTFRSGATEVYVSLYRVTQDSLNITDIDLLLPYADSIAEVKRNGGNKNLAAIEDGSTASQPYVKGEFVIVGGQFCEVTASISTNDAFIAYPLPNYNIKAGTVGEQITALNQNLTSRYNEQTHYYQAKINGEWVNDRYFNPEDPTTDMIPIMTSNTLPRGVCSANSTASGYQPYYAFNNSNAWYPAMSASNVWVQYKFDEPTTIRKVSAQIGVFDKTNVQCNIQISADGSTWQTVASYVTGSGRYPHTFEAMLEEPQTIQYIRLQSPNVMYGSQNVYVGVQRIHAYN